MQLRSALLSGDLPLPSTPIDMNLDSATFIAKHCGMALMLREHATGHSLIAYESIRAPSLQMVSKILCIILCIIS